MRVPNGDNRHFGCASRIASVVTRLFYAIAMISYKTKNDSETFAKGRLLSHFWSSAQYVLGESFRIYPLRPESSESDRMRPKIHTQYAMRTPNGDNRHLGCASRIAFVISTLLYAIEMISDDISQF